jgi:uncharacterized protein (UPF0332 family)
MNPEDFLDTAATLLLNTRESDYRSAVSRAYYAVYHIRRDDAAEVLGDLVRE